MTIRNPYHREILETIIINSGEATAHTYLDNYLGNTNKRYPIRAATVRTIARTWMRAHKDLPLPKLQGVLNSLVKGESSTEKAMVGVLLDYAPSGQRNFEPVVVTKWLDYLVGWAEVDSLCSGKFAGYSIPTFWNEWKPVLSSLSKSKNINKRRASLVLLIPSLRHLRDERISKEAFKLITRLMAERDVLITKAISWILRNMIRHYRQEVQQFIAEHRHSLPAIAVRETETKLRWGRKAGPVT